MSWTESEKLNEWIERAFENGRAEERERIIKLLESKKCIDLDYENGEQCLCGSWTESIALIKGENK